MLFRSQEEIIDNSIENIQEETLKKDEINIIENTETSTDRVQIMNTEESTKMDIADIGILSISSIFLITTIIFFIIFIKDKQKASREK